MRRPAGFRQGGERPARESDRQAATVRAWGSVGLTLPDAHRRRPAPAPRRTLHATPTAAGPARDTPPGIFRTMPKGDLGSRLWMPVEECERQSSTPGGVMSSSRTAETKRRIVDRLIYDVASSALPFSALGYWPPGVGRLARNLLPCYAVLQRRSEARHPAETPGWPLQP